MVQKNLDITIISVKCQQSFVRLGAFRLLSLESSPQSPSLLYTYRISHLRMDIKSTIRTHNHSSTHFYILSDPQISLPIWFAPSLSYQGIAYLIWILLQPRHSVCFYACERNVWISLVLYFFFSPVTKQASLFSTNPCTLKLGVKVIYITCIVLIFSGYILYSLICGFPKRSLK